MMSVSVVKSAIEINLNCIQRCCLLHFAGHFRVCSVPCISCLSLCSSLLQDAFFYSLVYDPTQKTLLADKGEIRVGPRFQADVPEMLQEGDQNTLSWFYYCIVFEENFSMSRSKCTVQQNSLLSEIFSASQLMTSRSEQMQRGLRALLKAPTSAACWCSVAQIIEPILCSISVPQNKWTKKFQSGIEPSSNCQPLFIRLSEVG